MKRFIALFLALLIVCSFAGCKSEGKDGEGYSVDIQYYISVGQIKEAQFSLGTPIADIEKEISKHSAEEHSGDGHDDSIVFVEGFDYNFYSTADFDYYYNPDKEDKGVSFIVGSADIYGFSVGQSGLYEVQSALELEELKPVLGEAEEEEFFFSMVSLEGCKKLTCTFENKTLVFYFENDILIAGVIFNDNWSI